MTDEQIANLRRLAEQATPGQWRTFVRSTDGMADDFLGVDLEGPPDAVRGQFARKEDVDFIVAARTAVPELLDALVAMTQRAEQAEREANSWIQAADDERTKLRHALAIARGRAEAAEAELGPANPSRRRPTTSTYHPTSTPALRCRPSSRIRSRRSGAARPAPP